MLYTRELNTEHEVSWIQMVIYNIQDTDINNYTNNNNDLQHDQQVNKILMYGWTDTHAHTHECTQHTRA